MIDAQLKRERIAHPKNTSCAAISVCSRPTSDAIHTRRTSDIPPGHTPRSPSISCPGRTSYSHVAPVSSSASRSKPTDLSVHAGAPEPPQKRDQAAWW
jgi:hypothetical protein